MANINALVPIFGSNRILAKEVGAALAGCSWVGVAFAGGMSEIPQIKANTLVVNDCHTHIINLAKILAHPKLGPAAYRQLRRKIFTAKTLREAQTFCIQHELNPAEQADEDAYRLEWAVNYFVSAWMGRSGAAGTAGEFNVGMATRWTASGGDSAVRYSNAVAGAYRFWRRFLARATILCMDAFDFLENCRDEPGHAIYADPPFYGPGAAYKFNCGNTYTEQVAWHTKLSDCLGRFQKARIVCRFYDIPLIRELYPEGDWIWNVFKGRKQTNDEAPEVLVSRR